jgi:cytochrome c biogenesis protein CcmG, thiol:disulfide interchange protein DsbE
LLSPVRSVPRLLQRAALLALLFTPGVGLTAPGGDLDLAQYRGKVVVIDFWASWCKPCRQSIPWLNQMRARYGESGLVIVGVNVDAVHSDAERFLRDVPIEFELVFDPQGALARRYEIKGMPTSVVVDRNGNIVQRFLGFRQAEISRHESELQQLLSATTRHE